jgi:putative flippase GtrA
MQKLREILGRALRGIGVGAVASLVDLVVLVVCVEALEVAPTVANAPALLAGALVQFVGCRHLVFRAHDGALGRQIVAFAATEAATLALNAIAFHLLVTLTPIPYGAARLLGTFVVFAGFSFPIWHRVFRRRAEGDPA